MLLAITLPILGGLCPQVWIDAGETPTMAAFTFAGVTPGVDGDWVSVDVDAFDGDGRPKANTSTRGMSIRIRLADPNNDPVIDRLVRSGAPCAAWLDIGTAYKDWPIDRVLPSTGNLSIVVTARRLGR